MKKFIFTGLLLTLMVSGCSYDDSEDIDILIPAENPKTKTNVTTKLALNPQGATLLIQHFNALFSTSVSFTCQQRVLQ